MEKKIYNNIVFHTETDLLNLLQDLKLPEFVKDSLLDSSEISHIRSHQKNLFIILSFPTPKIMYHPHHNHLHPLAIMINKQKITFIHNDEVDLNPFFNIIDKDDAIEILYIFLNYVFHLLEKEIAYIKKMLDEIEENVISSPDNKEIKNLFTIQKVVIRFQTAITGLAEMLNSFNTKADDLLLSNNHYKDYYNDLKIESNQLDKTINMINDTLKSLLDTAGSIQSNNLSRRMKTLTSLTIVISIPTLITGFYGMNIDLPFQDHPYSLLIVSVASFFITFAVTVYLYKKDLF